MKPYSRLNLLWIAGLAGVFAAAGCHSNQQAADNQNQPQQYSTDPAAGNVAPVSSGGTQATAPENGQQGYEQASPQQELPPSEDTADESQYGIQPQDTAPQPPPELPDYDQPPCPGDGYIWTPGYWYYGSAGYYWVPGAWVEAPFAGALWTPGYWAAANGRYQYFPGYWGRYVGFYGGIDYGFGYTGYGYHGGYWRGNQFDYDRSVNNINTAAVHNYYAYPVRGNGTSRVSFNGGRGGVQARPQLAELAALREPHAPPMNTQLQLRQQAESNRAQFAQENHGRPSQAAWAQPVAAERGVQPRETAVRNLPAAARPAPEAERNQPGQYRTQPAQQERAPQNEPQRSEPQRNNAPVNQLGPPRTQEHQAEPVYPETNRPAQRYAQPMRPNVTPSQPERPQASHEQPQRTEPQHEQPQRTEPQHAQPQRSQPERTQPQRTQPQREQPQRPEEKTKEHGKS